MSFRHHMQSRKGMSQIQTFLVVIIIMLFVLASYLFFPPTYANWKLGNMLRGIAQQSTNMDNTDQILVLTLETLQKQDYYFTPDQFRISKEGRITHIDVNYEVPIKIPLTEFGFVVTFNQHGTNDKF